MRSFLSFLANTLFFSSVVSLFSNMEIALTRIAGVFNLVALRYCSKLTVMFRFGENAAVLEWSGVCSLIDHKTSSCTPLSACMLLPTALVFIYSLCDAVLPASCYILMPRKATAEVLGNVSLLFFSFQS